MSLDVKVLFGNGSLVPGPAFSPRSKALRIHSRVSAGSVYSYVRITFFQ